MVVCAVKLCRNYTGKNIKPPEGISFHRFPTDPDQKQEWMQAIRRAPDWTPGTHCRVCSVHFDNTDFKISETGRRILHKDAVPSKNLYQEERQDTVRRVVRKTRPKTRQSSNTNTSTEDLQACRVCLATDVTLHDLQDKGLAQTIEVLTNIEVSTADGLPQYVCGICAALLQKYEVFRTRCHTAHDLLEEARGRQQLTTELIRNIDRQINQLTLPLTIKKQRIIDLTEVVIKQEHLDFTIPLEDTIDNINDDQDDFDIFDESNDQKLVDNEVKEEDAVETEYTEDDETKHEIFVEIPKHKSESKKRKSELKKKTKKIKKDVVPVPQIKKSDVRKTKPRKTDEDYENFSKMYNVDIMFLSKEEQIAEVQGRRESDNYKNSRFKCEQCFKGFTGEGAFKNHLAIHDPFLSREEQIAEVQGRRESDNYKNSRFKCEQCFKGFTGEGAFKNHLAIHDPSSGSHVCEPCGSRFSKRRQLLHHLTQHKMNLVCKLCNHVTKLLSKAKEHFKWHNGVKYPCHYCDKSFIKRTSQFNHMRNRHGSTACDICQEIFSGERGLSAHMQKAHREAVKCRCEPCGIQFYTEAALNRHIDTLPGNVCDSTTRACAECGDNFISEETLNEHMKENHWKEIKCDKCNANFENEKLYKMHRIIHKEFRNRKPRSEKDRLPKGAKVTKVKTKKVTKIQKRMCEMCGLTWRSSAALKYHQRVHTGEKPHQCPVCPKSFRIQDSLQIHMNTHTGARPFKCPHCPKAFKSRTQNHKHQLVHTKIRRYRCDLCDKTFQTSTCVKTHIRTVHMKIPAPPRARRPPAIPPAPYHAHEHPLNKHLADTV